MICVYFGASLASHVGNGVAASHQTHTEPISHLSSRSEGGRKSGNSAGRPPCVVVLDRTPMGNELGSGATVIGGIEHAKPIGSGVAIEPSPPDSDL